MKTISFMNPQRGNVSNPNVLHIEVPGGIVNIRIGIHDDMDRAVTSVEIIPDDFAGEEWRVVGDDGKKLFKYANVRIRAEHGIKRIEQDKADKQRIMDAIGDAPLKVTRINRGSKDYQKFWMNWKIMPTNEQSPHRMLAQDADAAILMVKNWRTLNGYDPKD